jgi:hypothetical protein
MRPPRIVVEQQIVERIRSLDTKDGRSHATIVWMQEWKRLYDILEKIEMDVAAALQGRR